MFPPAGSPDGRASFELFERLILRGAESQLEVDFNDLPAALEEDESYRHVMTHAVPFFPPMILYAKVNTDGSITLVDIEVDEEYWDTIGDDPI